MRIAAVALVLTGCNAVLGLEATRRGDGGGAIDAAGDASTVIDGAPGPDTPASCITPDEDNDHVGDACDNCPNLRNQSQTDNDIGGGDHVGDVCDVRPTVGGDSMIAFYPFNDPAEANAWTPAGPWTVQGGGYTSTTTAGNLSLAVINGLSDASRVIAPVGFVLSAGTTPQGGGIGVSLSSTNPSKTNGYVCRMLTVGGVNTLELVRYVDGVGTVLGTRTLAADVFSQVHILTFDHRPPIGPAAGTLDCAIDVVGVTTIHAMDDTYTSGMVGLWVEGTIATFTSTAVYK